MSFMRDHAPAGMGGASGRARVGIIKFLTFLSHDLHFRVNIFLP